MTTTTSTWAGAPAIARLHDDEEETQVYERKRGSARSSPLWNYVMVDQIMRELAKPRPARLPNAPTSASVPVSVRAAPNVFVTPRKPGDPPLPWAEPGAGPKTRRAAAPHRSAVLWLVFLMSFGIAFGLGRDRALRAELASQARQTAGKAVSLVVGVARGHALPAR
jgi:hypothetical protein